MTNFKRIALKLGVNTGDFNEWADKVLNPKSADPRKRLFDSYDKSLQRVEVYEMRMELFIRTHLDKPDFEAGYKLRGKRLRQLERASVERLKNIFEAYLATKKSR